MRIFWQRIAKLLVFLGISGITLATRPATAQVTTNVTTTAAFNGIPVSNSDLLQSNLSSVNTTGYSAFTNASGTFGNPSPILNNGSAAGNTNAASDWPNLVLEDTTNGRNGLWSVVYNLDLSKAPLGYSISRIDTLSGWPDTRAGQSYDLFFSLVNDPTFYQVPSGIGGIFGDSFGTQASNQGVRLSITDGTGVLGTGIDAIRFDMQLKGHSGTVFREIDVFGTPTPEPESIAIWCVIGVAVAGLAYARCRKQRMIGA